MQVGFSKTEYSYTYIHFLVRENKLNIDPDLENRKHLASICRLRLHTMGAPLLGTKDQSNDKETSNTKYERSLVPVLLTSNDEEPKLKLMY